MEWRPITEAEQTGGVFICWFKVGFYAEAFYMLGKWHCPRDMTEWSEAPTHWLPITPPDSSVVP